MFCHHILSEKVVLILLSELHLDVYSYNIFLPVMYYYIIWCTLVFFITFIPLKQYVFTNFAPYVKVIVDWIWYLAILNNWWIQRKMVIVNNTIRVHYEKQYILIFNNSMRRYRTAPKIRLYRFSACLSRIHWTIYYIILAMCAYNFICD